MKFHRERPSVWHVIVTLVAMYCLSCQVPVVFVLILTGGLDQGLTAAIFTLLVTFAWCFLIRDLIRQIFLFFPKKTK